MQQFSMCARALLPLIAVACVGCQSEKEGLQIICDAPKNIDPTLVSPAERQRALTDDIAGKLSNKDAIALYSASADLRLAARIDLLTKEAERLGIQDCAMIESLKAANGPVAHIEEYTMQLCECSSAACAEQVLGEMMKWAGSLEKPLRVSELDVSEQEELVGLSRVRSDCVGRLKPSLDGFKGELFGDPVPADQTK